MENNEVKFPRIPDFYRHAFHEAMFLLRGDPDFEILKKLCPDHPLLELAFTEDDVQVILDHVKNSNLFTDEEILQLEHDDEFRDRALYLIQNGFMRSQGLMLRQCYPKETTKFALSALTSVKCHDLSYIENDVKARLVKAAEENAKAYGIVTDAKGQEIVMNSYISASCDQLLIFLRQMPIAKDPIEIQLSSPLSSYLGRDKVSNAVAHFNGEDVLPCRFARIIFIPAKGEQSQSELQFVYSKKGQGIGASFEQIASTLVISVIMGEVIGSMSRYEKGFLISRKNIDGKEYYTDIDFTGIFDEFKLTTFEKLLDEALLESMLTKFYAYIFQQSSLFSK